MQLKKITATDVFDGQQMLPKGLVLLANAAGYIIDIVPIEQAGDDVLQLKGLLCPGFINTHCHIELSHFKDKMAKHTGLVGFIEKIMQLRNGALAEPIEAAMQAAADSMQQNGIVAVGDICNTSKSLALKTKSPLYWHSFMEVAGFVPAAAESRFAQIKELAQAFTAAGLPNSIAPHAPYSVSKDLLELIATQDVLGITSIHNQECAAENEWFQSKTGAFATFYANMGLDVAAFAPTKKTSLQSCAQQLQNFTNIIAVHNTFTSASDLQFLKGMDLFSKFHFCLCPKANLYIENSLPPVDLLREHKCAITLGTDSLASNKELCIASEMRCIQKHFPAISRTEILQWATYNGAKALGIEATYGSFEIGKAPGFVLLGDNFEVKRVAL